MFVLSEQSIAWLRELRQRAVPLGAQRGIAPLWPGKPSTPTCSDDTCVYTCTSQGWQLTRECPRASCVCRTPQQPCTEANVGQNLVLWCEAQGCNEVTCKRICTSSVWQLHESCAEVEGRTCYCPEPSEPCNESNEGQIVELDCGDREATTTTTLEPPPSGEGPCPGYCLYVRGCTSWSLLGKRCRGDHCETICKCVPPPQGEGELGEQRYVPCVPKECQCVGGCVYRFDNVHGKWFSWSNCQHTCFDESEHKSGLCQCHPYRCLCEEVQLPDPAYCCQYGCPDVQVPCHFVLCPGATPTTETTTTETTTTETTTTETTTTETTTTPYPCTIQSCEWICGTDGLWHLLTPCPSGCVCRYPSSLVECIGWGPGATIWISCQDIAVCSSHICRVECGPDNVYHLHILCPDGCVCTGNIQDYVGQPCSEPGSYIWWSCAQPGS